MPQDVKFQFKKQRFMVVYSIFFQFQICNFRSVEVFLAFLNWRVDAMVVELLFLSGEKVCVLNITFNSGGGLKNGV